MQLQTRSSSFCDLAIQCRVTNIRWYIYFEISQSGSLCRFDPSHFINSATHFSFPISSALLFPRICRLDLDREGRVPGAKTMSAPDVRFHEKNETHHPDKKWRTTSPRDSLKIARADFTTCAFATERKSGRLTKDCMRLRTRFSPRKNAVPHTRLVLQSYDTRLAILFASPLCRVDRVSLYLAAVQRLQLSD